MKRRIEIEGVGFHTWDDDKQLQIDDVADADLRKIWPKIENDFADYEKWYCCHNMDAPAFIHELGAVLEDDCVEMRLSADAPEAKDLSGYEVSGMVRITEDNFAEFAALHDARNPDMAWTSERLGREGELPRWAIFALRSGGGMNAYILLAVSNPTLAEIFVVEAPDAERRKALIAYAAKYAFENGKSEVLFQADRDSTEFKEALAVGFKICGFYKGYRVG
ncbi:MAG: hypothetical protein FWE90_07800 [Defluviitaleaceae bacterium]|nr:hypothetical protein [Defluviitaleaceae bacterium]